MMHFALPLHATREELIELAAAGVPMLSSHGSATFEFDAPPS